MTEATAVPSLGGGWQVESGSWVAAFDSERGLACEYFPAVPGRSVAMVEAVRDLEEGAGAGPRGRREMPVRIVFDGLLHNKRELALELGLPPDSGEIDLLWAGYRRWGTRLPARLEGLFALLLCDVGEPVLLAATDPLGSVPLYYASRGADLVLSPSLDRLVASPQVSNAIDRVVLAERLQHRFHSAAETCYAAVRAVLPGHQLAARRSAATPRPYAELRLTDELAGLGRAELGERFDALFEQAVGRCLAAGRAAVLLSGGLDSVAIAEAAVEIARRQGLDSPLALSFYLPEGAAASERAIQERVARELGMAHTLIAPTSEGGSLLSGGLECSRRAPFPIMNIWAATLERLLARGASLGCDAVLWGAGGDEWLGLNFALAADLLLGGRWRSLALLRRTMERSHGMSRRGSLRAVVWSYGLRLLLREALIRGGAVVPAALDGLRKRRAARRQPAWLSDDRTLRAALCERSVERALRREPGGFHRRDRRQTLRRPLQTLLRRQGFHLAASLGLRSLEPFWDRPLIEFLAAVPPELLMDGGFSKAPLRARLAPRLPDLGFAGQKKYDYEEYVYGRIRRECRELGLAAMGVPALVGSGIANDARMTTWLGRIEELAPTDQVHYLWTIYSIESWLAEHS